MNQTSLIKTKLSWTKSLWVATSGRLLFLELYHLMQWTHIDLNRNKVVWAPFDGPVALIRDDSKIVKLYSKWWLLLASIGGCGGYCWLRLVWRVCVCGLVDGLIICVYMCVVMGLDRWIGVSWICVCVVLCVETGVRGWGSKRGKGIEKEK